eukprot:181337_1
MAAISRKRAREEDEESEYVASSCDDSEEEYVPPPSKRRRRNTRKKVRNSKKSIQKEERKDSDEEEDPDSDVENTNTSNTDTSSAPSNWKSKMQKLVKKNIELRQENKMLKKEIAALKKTTKAASKTKAVNGKKRFQQFSKALVRIAKRKNTRFYGWHSTITVEQTVDKEEFNQLFGGKGHKIQPKPNYKPKSVKTIISFDNWSVIKQLFADHSVSLSKSIEVSIWRQGNIFRGKSFFMEKGTAEIDSLMVEYNRSSRQLKLNFSASRSYGDSEMGGNFNFLFI